MSKFQVLNDPKIEAVLTRLYQESDRIFWFFIISLFTLIDFGVAESRYDYKILTKSTQRFSDQERQPLTTKQIN